MGCPVAQGFGCAAPGAASGDAQVWSVAYRQGAFEGLFISPFERFTFTGEQRYGKAIYRLLSVKAHGTTYGLVELLDAPAGQPPTADLRPPVVPGEPRRPADVGAADLSRGNAAWLYGADTAEKGPRGRPVVRAPRDLDDGEDE